MSVATFKKIDSLMAKSGESGGASSVENALDWLRSKGDVDDETVNSFKKLDSVMARVGLKDSIAGPDRPFFAYVPFGATHAPHQAPQAYLDKYRGRFDEGWDVVRRRWYERQLELGVIPAGTELAPRNPGVDAWDDLPQNQRRLACRLQEAFAAFLDHTDDQIGRLVDGLRDMGQLDNTILVVLADNGASQEGGPFGVMHEMKFFNGIFDLPDDVIDQIDDIGGPHSHTNYPWGWAQCGNSPFKWYKQNTHEGGVHVPMIVHAPGVVAEPAGTKRTSSSTWPTSCRRSTNSSMSRRPTRTEGSSNCRSPVIPSPSALGRSRRADDEHAAVLRDGWQPGARRRSRRRAVEGGVQAHQGRRLRHRAVGAVPPRRRLVGVQRPRRGRTRQARRV